MGAELRGSMKGLENLKGVVVKKDGGIEDAPVIERGKSVGARVATRKPEEVDPIESEVENLEQKKEPNLNKQREEALKNLKLILGGHKIPNEERQVYIDQLISNITGETDEDIIDLALSEIVSAVIKRAQAIKSAKEIRTDPAPTAPGNSVEVSATGTENVAENEDTFKFNQEDRETYMNLYTKKRQRELAMERMNDWEGEIEKSAAAADQEDQMNIEKIVFDFFDDLAEQKVEGSTTRKNIETLKDFYAKKLAYIQAKEGATTITGPAPIVETTSPKAVSPSTAGVADSEDLSIEKPEATNPGSNVLTSATEVTPAVIVPEKTDQRESKILTDQEFREQYRENFRNYFSGGFDSKTKKGKGNWMLVSESDYDSKNGKAKCYFGEVGKKKYTTEFVALADLQKRLAEYSFAEEKTNVKPKDKDSEKSKLELNDAEFTEKVKNANDWDELYAVIRTKKEYKGIRTTYNANALIDIIERVRKGEKRNITRNFGIREKAEELMVKSGEVSAESREIFNVTSELTRDFINSLVGKLKQDDGWKKRRKEYQKSFLEGEAVSFLDELLEQEKIVADNKKEEFIKNVLKELADVLDGKENKIIQSVSDGEGVPSKNEGEFDKSKISKEWIKENSDALLEELTEGLKLSKSNIATHWNATRDSMSSFMQNIVSGRIKTSDSQIVFTLAGARSLVRGEGQHSGNNEDEKVARKFADKYLVK